MKKLNNKKLFLFDMDGTIYLDGVLFDGTLDLMNQIKKNGAEYVFITNNSSHPLNYYVDKISSYGIAVDENNFYTSTLATISYLNNNFKGKKIYCMGNKSLIKELKAGGINVTQRFGKNIDAVVIGYDTELNYKKLITISKILSTNKDIPYIATHPDFVCPVDFGFIPDCGSMVKMIEYATKRVPIYIGKPEPTMIDFVIKKYGMTKEQTVVIGDRLYTDIASGKNANVDTICVLSGETTIKDIENSSVKPDYIMKDVKEILNNIKKEV